MKRFIIAFLALLGLVAQGSPVSARLGGAEAAQHGVVLAQSAQAQKLIVQQTDGQLGGTRPERREAAINVPLSGTFRAVRVATVNIGIDRARQ